jgi:L-iditol 2-dehydrogenase
MDESCSKIENFFFTGIDMYSDKMKAVLMYGAKDVRIETVTTPKIGENEVLIKVESVGICATDVKKYIGVSSCKFPIILGHELAGSIVSLGSKVKGYKNGDRVSANPDMPCFRCKYCLQSKFNLCTNLAVIGYGTEEIEPINGAFAQYVKLPAWNLIKLEDKINYDQGTYIEPFTCVIRSFSLAKVNPTDSILILGDGRIGLLHTQLAKESGADRIIITGLSENRLTLAKKLGAHEVINVKNNNLVNYIKEHTSDGVDVVFDTTGVVSAAEQGIQLLAPHGRFIAFAGFAKGQNMMINPRDLHYKEIILTGSFGYGSPMDYYRAAHLITTKRINVDELTTQVRPLDGIEEGFIEISELKSIRTIIHPQE